MTAAKKDAVRDYVLGWCAEADWHPGARLPSIASMVAHLGVAKNTVIAALQDLAGEGVIESRERAGFFIRRRRNKAKAKAPLLTDFQYNRMEHGLAVVTLPYTDAAVNDVGGGTPAPSLLGTPAWTAELRNAAPRDFIATCAYSDPQGSPRLRESIAGNAFLSADAAVTPDAVAITQGGSEGLYVAMRWAIQHRGVRRVAVECPGYYLLYPMLASLGAEAVPIPRAKGELDLEYLRRMLRMGPIAALITNSNHHNPTGGSLTPSHLDDLASFAAKENLTVIEDDAYRGLWADRPEAPSLFSRQPEGNIYVSTFSKTLGAGLRVGFVLAQPAVTKQLRDLKFMINICGEPHTQEMLARFIDSRRYADHLAAVRLELKRRHKIAQAQAAPHASLGAFDGPYDGGLYLRYVFRDPLPMPRLYREAKAAGIIISPDELFYATETEVRANPSWMRVNVSACEQPRLTDVLRFVTAFRDRCADSPAAAPASLRACP